MKTFLPMIGKRRRGVFQPLELCALLLACVLAWVAPASAQKKAASGPTFDEYEVKAVFLLNFANYTEWPADTFADETAPFTIGVLGEDPFGKRLESALKDEKVKSREVKIRRAKKPEDLKDCHLVFVARSERPRLDAVIATFKGKPVLTIADMDGFCRTCGIVNFVTEDNRVRFQINSEAARANGLKISSRLLSLASIIECDALKGAP
jgi:hypothetical protein